MYLNIIRAISALALTITTTIGTQDIHKTSSNTQAVLNTETVQTSSGYTIPDPISLMSQTIPQQKNQNNSATTETKEYTREQKVEILQKYLVKHNSPMINNAQDFIDASEQYDLEWTLIPAIAGVESTFGKNVLKNSHNPFGWGGGYYMFNSWREAIYAVSEGMAEYYIKQGLNTPEKMQPKYAPPSTDWSTKVRYFMNKIQQEAEEYKK